MFAKESGKGLAAVWFKFFLDAGVPPSDAGSYAVTFTEHRIQPEMLSDLTKDYLADMGITVLGDVIAILKHARIEHTKKSKEQALKCSGLAVQSSSSVDAASVTKTSLTTTKRPAVKSNAVNSADSAAPASTTPLQIPTSRSLARGSNVGVEESRRSKPATATASVSAVSGNVTKTRQLQKQPVQGALVNRAQLSNMTVASQTAPSLSHKYSSTAAAKPQTMTSVSESTRQKSVTVLALSSSTSSASKTSTVFSRLGDKLSGASSSRTDASSADRKNLTKTKPIHDRLGPAKSDTATQSSAASVNLRVPDSQPKLMIPMKRKLVAETVSATAADGLQFKTEKLNTKSSVRSRLGEPVTSEPQQRLMIPTKRKQVDETVSATAADGMQSKIGKSHLSIQSRLGERATSEPQSALMSSTSSRLSATGAANDEEQLGHAVSTQYKTVFSRLGPIYL